MKFTSSVFARIALALLALSAFSASASAEVIVYKGSARAGLDAINAYSKAPRAYFVVDLSAKTSYLVLYYKRDGAKGSTQFFPFDGTRYNGEPINDTLRVGTFSSVLDTDFGAAGFTALMLYFRGRETSLVLSNGGTPDIGSFPKVLTGFLREAQAVSATHTNFELNFSLTFDSIHTQAANNGFKDGVATITDIDNELTALGY